MNNALDFAQALRDQMLDCNPETMEAVELDGLKATEAAAWGGDDAASYRVIRDGIHYQIIIHESSDPVEDFTFE